MSTDLDIVVSDLQAVQHGDTSKVSQLDAAAGRLQRLQVGSEAPDVGSLGRGVARVPAYRVIVRIARMMPMTAKALPRFGGPKGGCSPPPP